ncbi:hypothetical protein [Halorubrum ezzemoulense]|uniref:hypothetical protein n=1 Tax=Halorubrum ezzemoulense TaxID=337243 RepID=UPI00117A66DF|nr:hypothetical protein [Halorubrum ezzemoulense]
MFDNWHRGDRDLLLFLKYQYYSLLPWLIYVIIGVILEIVRIWYFPARPSSAGFLLYYSFLVPHQILLISLISVILIKFISTLKATLVHVWRSCTPPFDSEVEIFSKPEPTKDIIQTAQKKGILFLSGGYLLGEIIPSFGEIPLRYGSISFTELPSLPYPETLTEIASGFPIVGDVLALSLQSLISVQSPVLYIPISISAFLMLIGAWNLSYASRYFLQVESKERKKWQQLLFELLAILTGPLVIVYVYYVF